MSATTRQVRLDKWLKVARLFKTRSKASQACAAGRVQVNGFTAKAHRVLSLGDRIEVRFGDWSRILLVRELKDKPVAKAVARELYEDLSPPRPRRDLIERILHEGSERRKKGKGRPTKRERREIERLKKK